MFWVAITANWEVLAQRSKKTTGTLIRSERSSLNKGVLCLLDKAQAHAHRLGKVHRIRVIQAGAHLQFTRNALGVEKLDDRARDAQAFTILFSDQDITAHVKRFVGLQQRRQRL